MFEAVSSDSLCQYESLISMSLLSATVAAVAAVAHHVQDRAAFVGGGN
jgi:hypothetical protein